MKVQELLTRLSHSELSNLSIGQEGAGSIKPTEIPKIITHANDGLLRLYSRFILSTNQLILETREHITNYHLIKRFAESTGSDEECPYIKDLPEEPFLGDVIRILEVWSQHGHQFVLNDTDDPRSLFTPAPEVLQVPRPKEAVMLSIVYQARHEELKTNENGQEIDLPFVLEGALQAFIGYKIFSNMNGQDNLVKAQELLNTYDSICVDVETRDLVNTTFATSHRKLEERGFS